jgi:hypothetical protein
LVPARLIFFRVLVRELRLFVQAASGSRHRRLGAPPVVQWLLWGMHRSARFGPSSSIRRKAVDPVREGKIFLTRGEC